MVFTLQGDRSTSRLTCPKIFEVIILKCTVFALQDGTRTMDELQFILAMIIEVKESCILHSFLQQE